MPLPDVPYRKLPGRSPTLRFGVTSAPASSLWLGPDHLLLVLQTPTREEYRRFDYRDIQEVFVQENNRRLILNIVLGVIIAILAGIAAVSSFGPVSVGFLAVMGGPALILLIVNTVLGPTSRGYLLTAVGVEELSSLSRLGTARRAVAQLTEEIQRVQGTVDAPTLAVHWQQS